MSSTPVAEQAASEPPVARVRDQAREALTLMVFSGALSVLVAVAALLLTTMLHSQGR